MLDTPKGLDHLLESPGVWALFDLPSHGVD